MKQAAKQGIGSLFVLLMLGLVGCASNGPKPAAFDTQLAKETNSSAAQAAVAKPGTKVCRWLQIGIAERELLRGVVLQQEDAQALRVRIEDPGRFTNSLNGTPLARGALVHDKAIAWTPCVF